ncbi:hypothetical protein K490DRAFT_69375 [Saccharata proteae CBS 121410]|uniref:Uncharacterized protein n=1 Tax=Saccharata proteae CBS 121410 TaxID=1314787 RepID=A0A9P4HP34_9PEZI|nr:hypothetical protein K490DRAFT_69375 [Saccharata proteae CBS 121410]
MDETASSGSRDMRAPAENTSPAAQTSDPTSTNFRTTESNHPMPDASPLQFYPNEPPNTFSGKLAIKPLELADQDLDAVNPEKKRKKEPTTTRLSGTQKARLASSNVALYAALARSVKKGQAGLLTGLRGYLSSLKMSGHKKTVASGSYYAVVFDTTKHGDETLGKITQDYFPKFLRQDKTEVRIDVAKFGAQLQEGPRVWSIAADPLASMEDLVGCVTRHVSRYMPEGYEATVTLAAKMESERDWELGGGLQGGAAQERMAEADEGNGRREMADISRATIHLPILLEMRP